MQPHDVSDVPFGTEVFVIIPDDLAPIIEPSKDRLYATLSAEFPQFDFSLGRGVNGRGGEWAIMTVAGMVGDGWKKARPVKLLSREDHQAILECLTGFVAGDIGRPN